jgi:hypothetical protein
VRQGRGSQSWFAQLCRSQGALHHHAQLAVTTSKRTRPRGIEGPRSSRDSRRAEIRRRCRGHPSPDAARQAVRRTAARTSSHERLVRPRTSPVARGGCRGAAGMAGPEPVDVRPPRLGDRAEGRPLRTAGSACVLLRGADLGAIFRVTFVVPSSHSRSCRSSSPTQGIRRTKRSDQEVRRERQSRSADRRWRRACDLTDGRFPRGKTVQSRGSQAAIARSAQRARSCVSGFSVGGGGGRINKTKDLLTKACPVPRCHKHAATRPGSSTSSAHDRSALRRQATWRSASTRCPAALAVGSARGGRGPKAVRESAALLRGAHLAAAGPSPGRRTPQQVQAQPWTT